MIASVTTTCTRMMSSILGLLTSTWPRANAEREHGIQSIVGCGMAIGNFYRVVLHCSLLGVMWTIQTLAATQNLAMKVLLITGHARLAQVNISF